MKYLFLLFAISATIFGCRKENMLKELEFNKWENEIPNFISIDSSVSYPLNPSNGKIYVYISFNQSYIESEWDKIKTVHVAYQRYYFSFPFSTPILKTVPFSNGYGVFEPQSTYNSTDYRFQFYIEFVNGRKTLISNQYQLITTPFV